MRRHLPLSALCLLTGSPLIPRNKNIHNTYYTTVQSSMCYQSNFGKPSGNRSPTISTALNPSMKDLSFDPETRAAMRDDNVIIADIVRSISQLEGANNNNNHNKEEGHRAVSIKLVYTRLSLSVQEALSEKYDGLLNFLKSRKQFFLLVTDPSNPTSGTTYVKINDLLKNKYRQRELQKNTITDMLGIDRNIYKPVIKKKPPTARGRDRSRGRSSSSSSSARGRGKPSFPKKFDGSKSSPKKRSWSAAYRGAMDANNTTFGAPS
ncbi:hypothetical protein ADEAN_000484500 [Angomonas deanei]|uniref:Uncharacterized protein n=1 Tax=Angomonas deanei TaxID=59799 RepID=A0A7G2CEE9_9TRYP|nr:hypothetical protein ADEAN_000484500 [Angomonas deanei]